MRNVIVILILVLLTTAASQATVRTFVSTSGSDAADCSRATPCRTFTAAMNAVDDGGEVLVLDSGGYSPVVINRSVSIISPALVHAAIAPTAGSAITILAGSGSKVALRGLYLNSQGATTGIEFETGRDLYVESCVISGFANRGIDADRGGAFGQLFVSDTTVRRCGVAILTRGSEVAETVWTSIDDSRLLDGGNGLYAQDNSRVTISRTILGNNGTGVAVLGGQDDDRTHVNIEDCVISNSQFAAIDTASAGGTCVVTLSESLIAGSGTSSISVGSGTTVQTRQNNTLGDGPAVAGLTALGGI